MIPSLDGVAGFRLVEIEPIQIPAGRETYFLLHLIGDRSLKPGRWNGLLHLEPEGKVDLLNNDIPVQFELIQPSILATVQGVEVGTDSTCLSKSAVWLTLEFESTSLITETVQLGLHDLPDARIANQKITVSPGTSRVRVQIIDPSSASPGERAGKISFHSTRPGLQLQPELPLAFSYSVAPFWIQCRKPMIFSGVLFILSVMIISKGVKKALKTRQPARVTGTLIYWDRLKPDQVWSINLTELKKTQIRIGKGSHCDLVLADPALEHEHAILIAEHGEGNSVRLTLKPIGKITRGYRNYTITKPLEENTLYGLGSFVLKFIQDIQF